MARARCCSSARSVIDPACCWCIQRTGPAARRVRLASISSRSDSRRRGWREGDGARGSAEDLLVLPSGEPLRDQSGPMPKIGNAVADSRRGVSCAGGSPSPEVVSALPALAPSRVTSMHAHPPAEQSAPARLRRRDDERWRRTQSGLLVGPVGGIRQPLDRLGHAVAT